MKTVHKVRALVLDSDGGAYAIKGNAAHVLQLPGGTRHLSEQPKSAIRREIREELGYEIEILKRVGVLRFQRNGTMEVTTLFVVRITGGKGKPKLTRREARRGLHTRRYRSAAKLQRSLRRTVARYGQSAALRDLTLIEMALRAI